MRGRFDIQTPLAPSLPAAHYVVVGCGAVWTTLGCVSLQDIVLSIWFRVLYVFRESPRNMNWIRVMVTGFESCQLHFPVSSHVSALRSVLRWSGDAQNIPVLMMILLPVYILEMYFQF